MRALLACAVLAIASLASGVAVSSGAATQSPKTASAVHASTSRTTARPTTAPAGRPTKPVAPKASGSMQRNAAMPAGAHLGPASLKKASASEAPTAATRPGNNLPAALGGPAKYDSRKGAMLGGTVMRQRP